MLGALYERLAAQPDGLRLLAAARLRRKVIKVLHRSLELSGLSQSDLGKRLGRRRSAVNQVFKGDGNVRVETLAEYLYEMGFELDLQLVPAGELRRAALEQREARPMPAREVRTTPPVVVDVVWRQPLEAPPRIAVQSQKDLGLAAFRPQTTSPSTALRLGMVG
ncbi:hypothetical protein GCM10022248_89250 [Nonomuraea soli]